MQQITYRQGISLVRGEFKMQTSDSYVNCPDRLILNELQNTTIVFITQRTDKRMLWSSPNIYTEISCLALEQVPLAECCDFVSDCTIARTLVQLPKIAEGTNFGMLIQGLYSIDGVSRRFIESTPDRYRNSLKLGLINKQIHFFIKDKYLYIGDENIEKVRLSAYFEEDIPESLIPYPSYCNTNSSGTLVIGCCPQSTQSSTIPSGTDYSKCCPVNPYDLPWKIPSKLTDPVIKEVANKLLNTYKRSVDDKTPDGKDSTE